MEAFLKTIDCYVMGSRTYETALNFEAKGFGWAYGDKPTFVLTRRELPRTRDTVEFYSGDLAQLVNGRLRPTFHNIWFVGGGVVSGECLRLGLADEVRYSILPILIGDGIPFFEKLDRDVALHLAEVDKFLQSFIYMHLARVAGLLLVSIATLAQQQSVEITSEPSHHLVLENAYVRVFDVTVAPKGHHAGPPPP